MTHATRKLEFSLNGNEVVVRVEALPDFGEEVVDWEYLDLEEVRKIRDFFDRAVSTLELWRPGQ